MPLYPRSAMSQGACPNFLFFRCFHLKLTFESLEEVGNVSSEVLVVIAPFFDLNYIESNKSLSGVKLRK
jgi:hypothetical protein